MSERSTRTIVLAGVVLALVGGGAAWYASRAPTASEPGAVVDAEDAGVVAWCAPGLEAIAGGGCFAPARGGASPSPLLIYLHGRYDLAGTRDEMDRQHRVAERATARGFAVLALHGKIGECVTSPELATWFCWPSNEHTASDAPAFVAAWAPALRAAERRTGAGAKRFVLGFSNGAYFAGLLAVGAHFEASAFAVANGGTVEPVHAAGAKPPVLLLSADSDESQPGMIHFDAELTRERWPHEVYARPGAHALQNEDIDAVVSFFLRSQTEKLPLSPPLTTHRPTPHVATPDAGEEPRPSQEETAPPTENPYESE